MATCLNLIEETGVTAETSKCVDRLDGSNKIEPNHQFCIRPPDDMVTKQKYEKLKANNTGEYIGAAFKYLGAIVVDRYSVCAKECGRAGCAGQMYVQETNAKCQPDTHRDCTVNKYIVKDYSTFKNFLSGRSKNESDGQLASAIADLARPITDNQILKAMTESPVPLCKAVRLKCSVLHVGPNDTGEYYGRYGKNKNNLSEEYEEDSWNQKENTGKVWISYSDLLGKDGLYARRLVIDDSGAVITNPPFEEMEQNRLMSESGSPVSPDEDESATEGFNSKRSKSFESIKTKQPSVHPSFFNDSEVSKSFDGFSNYNSSNNNDYSVIHEKVYFILLSLFLSYIIYKMLYNKK